MTTVKLLKNFQVFIPKSVCEQLGVAPGEELRVYVSQGEIHLQPLRTVDSLRGMAKGMKWKVDYRDRDDRF